GQGEGEGLLGRLASDSRSDGAEGVEGGRGEEAGFGVLALRAREGEAEEAGRLLRHDMGEARGDRGEDIAAVGGERGQRRLLAAAFDPDRRLLDDQAWAGQGLD